MANSLNKAMLIGHLGDDVKIHYFDKGNCLARFPIATNETFVNKQSGERITNTEWHNVVVRNKLAELCEKYLSKGDRVYVEGRIKTRSYEQDGQKKYSTEIHANEMTFLTTKKDLSVGASPAQQTHQGQAPQHSSTANDEEDDLPF
ncbi:single-stranded DNA-binding protein [Namhaeicola litoreus]|uniref:Single-stranded DNA-binding protein n=1 Tax=Namhaeicola litoreus TaxID=1052145 RepID=A0ABW3XY58_9FLAO